MTRRSPARSDPAAAAASERSALRLWVRLLACAHSAEQRVKARIKESFGINQTQFNLLSQLDRAPGGIRMGELSRRTVVTGSNVTAVVDDLIGRGLVARERVPDDRRAILIRLTPAGRDAFARWSPVHAAWVREVFSELSETDQLDLIAQLDRLKAAMKATLSTSL